MNNVPLSVKPSFPSLFDRDHGESSVVQGEINPFLLPSSLSSRGGGGGGGGHEPGFFSESRPPPV